MISKHLQRSYKDFHMGEAITPLLAPTDVYWGGMCDTPKAYGYMLVTHGVITNNYKTTCLAISKKVSREVKWTTSRFSGTTVHDLFFQK